MRLTNTSAVAYHHIDFAIHTNAILVSRLLLYSPLHGPRRQLDGPHEAARLGTKAIRVAFSRLGVREARLLWRDFRTVAKGQPSRWQGDLWDLMLAGGGDFG